MRSIALIFVAVIAGCAGQGTVNPAGTACVAADFQVTDQFAGARRGTCRVLGENKVLLEILREDDDVRNPSAWFAFKLSPNGATTANILLDYGTWSHRYWPKTSSDGITWTPMAEKNVSVSADEHRANLRVPLTDEALWVSAQELITPSLYDIWLRKIADTTDATVSELGRSKAGLPIHVVDTNPVARDVILLIGRQHPPEVSGVFAFTSFAETLLGQTELASAFRERYRILAVPLLNPDGVVGGNWRHNLGGVDLNRDWGPFTQPETGLIGNLLDTLDDDGHRLRVFVDFHSTANNLFYTQLDEDITDPPNFTRDWLAAAKPRLVNYPFRNELRSTENSTISKNYIYGRYGIPAFTYEVGDESDRAAVQAAAVVFAEEFMKLLLRK